MSVVTDDSVMSSPHAVAKLDFYDRSGIYLTLSVERRNYPRDILRMTVAGHDRGWQPAKRTTVWFQIDHSRKRNNRNSVQQSTGFKLFGKQLHGFALQIHVPFYLKFGDNPFYIPLYSSLIYMYWAIRLHKFLFLCMSIPSDSSRWVV